MVVGGGGGPSMLATTPQQPQMPQPARTMYIPPMPPTSFTLSSAATELSASTQAMVSRDAKGRVLWFNVPPVDPQTPVIEGGARGHSVEYLARLKEVADRKRKRAEARAEEHNELAKRAKAGSELGDEEKKRARDALVDALTVLEQSIVNV